MRSDVHLARSWAVFHASHRCLMETKPVSLFFPSCLWVFLRTPSQMAVFCSSNPVEPYWYGGKVLVMWGVWSFLIKSVLSWPLEVFLNHTLHLILLFPLPEIQEGKGGCPDLSALSLRSGKVLLQRLPSEGNKQRGSFLWSSLWKPGGAYAGKPPKSVGRQPP